MNKVVLQDVGVFYKRITHKVQIKPFTLKETKDYLCKIKNSSLSNDELVEAQMHFGGIPFYLNLWEVDKGFVDNIVLF